MIALTKARAMCGEYLPEADASGALREETRLSKKDLQKIRDDFTVMQEVPLTKEQEELQDAIAQVVRGTLYDLITTFSEYFTDDFENELKRIVRACEMFKVVKEDVKARNAIAAPSADWPQERQDAYRARMAYLFAKRRIEGMKKDVSLAERYLGLMASYICEKYGDCLGSDF